MCGPFVFERSTREAGGGIESGKELGYGRPGGCGVSCLGRVMRRNVRVRPSKLLFELRFWYSRRFEVPGYTTD